MTWSEETVEVVVNAVCEKLPSLGFNNPLNPFPDDLGNGKWAMSIATECTQAALSAISNSKEWKAREWRPISEAPRDGTPVLLYGGSHNRDNCEHKIVVAHWNIPPCSTFKASWVITFDNIGYGSSDFISPTHFQHLPTPPTEASDGK